MRLAPRFLAVVAALLMLSACAVPPAVQQAVEDAVRAVGQGGDGATLVLTESSATFDAGDATAHNVTLYFGGVNLVVTDSRCEVINNGVGCDLGSIDDSTVVTYTGSDISANVSYYREDVDTPLFFYVRLP